MKNYKKRAFALSILIALLCAITGCDIRQDIGEDLNIANKTEIRAIKDSLVYFSDEYGNCFAVLNNHTDGFRSTFTFSSIDCNKMP